MRAVAAALDKKALEPVLLDVSQLASYTDFILIVSGRSDRQVQAITEGVVAAFAEVSIRPIGVEGVGAGQWALVDFGNVVVHVFHHPIREFYDLEGLWNDAVMVPLDVPPESRLQPGEAY